MLKPLVLGAEIGRKAVRAATRVPGADRALARLVVASGRVFPTAVDEEFSGSTSRLRGLHGQAANVLLEANPAGARKLLESLEIDSITNADHLERLAARFSRLREFDAALQMRQRAADLEPDNPVRHIALARSLLRTGGRGIVRDPLLGITEGVTPRADEARQSLEAAQRLAPDHPAVLHERGLFEFDHGDLEQGVQLLSQAVERRPSARWYTELGQRCRKPHVEKLDTALGAYEKALELRPKSAAILRSVIILGCRTTHDWPRLWANAQRHEQARGLRDERRQLMDQIAGLLFTGDPVTQGQAQQASETLKRSEEAGTRLSWPVTSLVAYRLQFAGFLSTGFALRHRLAERTLTWLGTTSAGHTGHRQKLLASLVYLERFDQALELIDPLPWTPQSPRTEQKLRKLAADVHLVRGELAPYLEYSRTGRTAHPMAADDLMETMVRGKRVAVVGPVDTGDRLGELIDSYDVIVRPRFAPEFVADHQESQGSRTDIVYLNAHDLGPVLEQTGEAVRQGALKMVIARPTSLQENRDWDIPWLRFHRHEFSLSYHGALLGVQRYIYDLLQFEPAEIAVFNSDMYTGSQAFGTGYREQKDFAFGPGSAMNDLLVNHDLCFDHKFLKWLHRTGVLTLHGRTAEVGEMTSAQYTAALDSGGALR